MGCCGGGHRHGQMQESQHTQTMPAANEDPQAILKARLARGEITIEEYRRLAEALKG